MEDRIEFMEGVLALLVAERYGVELNELEENIIDDFFNNQYYRPWLPKEEWLDGTSITRSKGSIFK